MAGAVPGVGAVLRVVNQLFEERRRKAVEVALGFTNDVARHELRRVFKHVDEAMKLTQHIVGQVLGGPGLAVDVDGDVGVLEADLFDELAQVGHHRIQLRAGRELVVVDGEDEGRGQALLLGERAQVTVARDAEHRDAFFLDRLRQRTDAEAGGVLRAVVLVDDDDGEVETHHRWRPSYLINLEAAQFRAAGPFIITVIRRHARYTARSMST